MAKSKVRVKAGKKSRRKGKVAENVIAHVMNDWCGVAHNTDLSFRRWWAGREETGKRGDLKVPTWFPFVVEIRDREGWSFESLFTSGSSSTILQWWRELKEKNAHAPMLMVFTRNHQPNFVMFGFDERHKIEQSFGPLEKGMFTVMRVFGVIDTVFIAKLDDLLKFMDPEGFRGTMFVSSVEMSR